MKGKNSINNHLTQHYNKYHNSFGYKPDSQNQKTVLLKIGERPSIDISTKEYFDNLPRKKQKILKQIHGESLTPTEISKIIEQQFLKLQQLDTALCKYTELKDKYMQELWNKQGKDQTSFQKIKEFTDIDEELIKQHIKYYDAIKKNQTKIAQSIGNPRLADKLHTIIRDNLKDQISSTYFHKKFMANLWSDVATDYLGYLIKFQKSIEEFKETKLKVIDSLKDINQELNLAINPFQNSGKDKAHLSKAWTILQAEFSGNTKKGYSSFSMRLTYDEYNLRYSKIKSALNVLCQSQDIEESLKSFNLRSFLESYKNGKITRINFDHNQTFPWNNKPKLTPIELVTELNELITKYNQDTNKPQTKSYYNKKTNQKKTKPIELDLKKVYKNYFKTHPFQINKKGQPVTNIPDDQLSPQAKARKKLCEHLNIGSDEDIINYQQFSNVMNSLKDWSYKKIQTKLKDIESLKQNWINQTEPDLLILRELACFTEVYVDAIARQLQREQADELKRQANKIITRIQGCWWYFENQPETKSLFLSGMYRQPSESTSLLCTNQDNSKLNLLVNFENTLDQGNLSTKCLVYKNNQDQYLDDPDNSTKYLEYNNPSLESIKYSNKDFIFKLHFAKNQSRKYFWNNFRKNQEGRVHHIFDPNSRLKVSSMRLIRKHNAIKQQWEYYLSLNIFRLEDSKVQISTKDFIHGYDIGENSLLEVSTVNLNSGQKLNTYFNSIAFSHFQNHKNSQNLIFNEVESSITKKNYISPKTRKKIHDKSLAVQRQASSFISKEAIKGNYNIFEHQYIQKIHSNKQNSKDNLIKKQCTIW